MQLRLRKKTCDLALVLMLLTVWGCSSEPNNKPASVGKSKVNSWSMVLQDNEISPDALEGIVSTDIEPQSIEQVTSPPSLLGDAVSKETAAVSLPTKVIFRIPTAEELRASVERLNKVAAKIEEFIQEIKAEPKTVSL